MHQCQDSNSRIAATVLVLLLLCAMTGCGLPGHGEWILVIFVLGVLGTIALLTFALVKYLDHRYQRKQ